MASANLFKSLFLVVTTFTTIGLLTFCLVSDWWIQVDPVKLKSIQTQYQRDYDLFSSNQAADERKSSIGTHLNKDIFSINENDHRILPEPSVTTTTATTTATNPTDTTTSVYAYDYKGHDYGPYDYQQYDDPFSEDVNKKIKRHTKVVDYVYVKKLWPLIKFKSLYSECIEYKEFPLKISAAYLVQSNKEPLIGQINYGEQLNALLKSERLSADMCEPGMIRCVLSQQCVRGKFCDGTIDCSDQSDEQQCNNPVKCQSDEHSCDNKCWKSWHRCDKNPHCSDLSDENTCSNPDESSMISFFKRMLSEENATIPVDMTRSPAAHEPFTFGKYHFDPKHQCFVHYFDFKSAELVKKENLQYLSQTLADHLQEAKNINFHIHLIYSLSFAAALVFSIMSLFSLVFVVCSKRTCFQCPFWFYGFFNILAWLASSFGLLTFLYEFIASKQRTLDPLSRLPIDNELIRLNTELASLQVFGFSFWFAVAATSMSFFSSFVSCIICCRLPTARHEDKEYKIMQLPTYS